MRNDMRTAFTVLLSTFVLFGCPKKGDGADAAAEAAVVAEPPPIDAAAAPHIEAKNAADVARFAGETAVADDDAKTMSVATVRTSPRGGTVVATLKIGTDVTKVAEYQTSMLITFADPKDANVTLMGWVGKEGFTAFVHRPKTDAAAPVADAGGGTPAVVTCGAGQVAVIITKDPVCKRKCATNTDCKNKTAGSCQNANGVAGTVVRACVSDP